MRLLWIINIPLPPLCEKMGWKQPVIGGWLYSSFKHLAQYYDIQMFVASPFSRGRELVDMEIDGVRYFAIPYGYSSTTKKHTFIRKYWKLINDEVKPDIVHIHGTEFAHGNDFVHACGADNVIVSIQGLVSVIARYYLGGIQKKDILKTITLRDIIRKSTIIDDQKDFARRGEIEIDTLRRVNYVIGRTEWDKSHIWSINPKVEYYHCDEILRDVFYNNRWSYCKCDPHSIFISQSAYPIKGLQIVLAALPFVIERYPDTIVYVAGPTITCRKPLYRYTGYGKYISKIIDTLGIREHVEFTGELNESDICERYLRSNLFICSSIIENSPNSLGEAQLLGVPVLAAYAGGIPDMMKGNEGNLYRYDDAEMLAYKICELFGAKAEVSPSESIRESALFRHSRDNNLNTLIDIYKVLQKKRKIVMNE